MEGTGPVGALSSVSMRFVAFGNDLPGQVATPAKQPTQPPPPIPGNNRPPIDRTAAEAALRARPAVAARLAAISFALAICGLLLAEVLARRMGSWLGRS